MNVEAIDDITGRYQISTGVRKEDLESLAINDQVKTIQFSHPLSLGEIEMLEALVFSRRKDIMLRVYGYDNQICNLSFLNKVPSLRRFSADCLSQAKGIESVAELKYLELLGVGIYNLDSFDFLDKITPNLKELYLYRTESKKPDISGISRFTKLEKFYLERHQRGIDSLRDLKDLKEITLHSISTPNLDYLSDLPALWSVAIKLGGIKAFDSLKHIPNLKSLELWHVRGLNDLSFLTELYALQRLSLESLNKITSFPDMSGLKSLRRIGLSDMKGLANLDSLKNCPALEDFSFYSARNFTPEQIVPVLENSTVKNVACRFGSDKKNTSFEQLAAAYHKSTKIERFQPKQ